MHVDQKLTRSWWCRLCTGPICWVWGLYSPNSLKQQFVSRHVAPPGTLFLCMSVKSSQDDDGVCFVLDQHAEFEVYIILAHWNSPWVETMDHRAPYFLCMSMKSSQDDDGVCFELDQHAEFEVDIDLAHWNNSSWVDMLHHRAPYFLCMSVKSSQDHDCVCFVLDQHAESADYIVLAHWNNSPWVDMLHHRAPYFCVCRSKAHKMMMVSALYWINTLSLRFI